MHVPAGTTFQYLTVSLGLGLKPLELPPLQSPSSFTVCGGDRELSSLSAEKAQAP